MGHALTAGDGIEREWEQVWDVTRCVPRDPSVAEKWRGICEAAFRENAVFQAAMLFERICAINSFVVETSMPKRSPPRTIGPPIASNSS
jgi:hypothetical protein